MSALSLHDKVMATRDTISERTGAKPVFGVILGSGLGALAESLDDSQSIPYSDLVHIPKSTVPGHAGSMVMGSVEGVEIAVMSGRSHFYEGHSLSDLTIGVRALVALGCRGVVVTNAAGGIRTEFHPGDLMCISDHLNLQWQNPLMGVNDDRLGPRFVDMTLAYDRRLRRILHKNAEKRGTTLHDGVYAAISGPSYETPAEIRMLRAIGADAVGMSTVHEVIAARHAGARVCGMSLISNLAAGIEDTELSHAEVTATANRSQGRTVQLLKDFLPAAATEVLRAKQ